MWNVDLRHYRKNINMMVLDWFVVVMVVVVTVTAKSK